MFNIISQSLIALLLLIATSGLTINIHYCNDHVYDIGILSSAKSCCENGHHDHCKMPAGEKGHCAEGHIIVQLDNDYVPTLLNFDLTPVMQAALTSTVNIRPESEPMPSFFHNYLLHKKIPPGNLDRQLALIQTYLI